MSGKRVLVTALVGLNLLLLLALLMQTTAPSAAFAQAGGGGGPFLSVTAKAAGQSYDVVYLLDVQQDRLHALFVDNFQARKFGQAKFRDLKADFDTQ